MVTVMSRVMGRALGGALGLHRCDMHLPLARRILGRGNRGAHLHVIR